MNTLLAIIVFSLLVYNGTPKTNDEPIVFELQENMPAEKQGCFLEIELYQLILKESVLGVT